MKKVQLIVLLCFNLLVYHAQVTAQTYGHEWINFNQQYYKFYINADGIYRINYNKLVQLGLQNVPGSQFAVYNLGREIPIYVSTSGILGASDFILIPCNRRDGAYDNGLYDQPGNNPNVFTSATFRSNPYFLTYGTGQRERYELRENPIPITPPTASPYVKYNMNATDLYFIPGFSNSTSNNYYSSAFDRSEGMGISGISTAAKTFTTPLLNYNFQPQDSTAYNTYYFSLSNTNLTNNNNIKVKINGVEVFDTTLPPVTYIRKSIRIPSTLLTNANTNLEFTGTSHFNVFEYSFSNYRQPTFVGFTPSNYFNFTLPKEYNYYEFPTPSLGDGVFFYLFDRTSQKVYKTTRTSATLQRLLADASSQPRDVIGGRSNQISDAISFLPVSFNAGLVTNLDKNYLVIADSFLVNANPNYIGDYVSYRNSSAGGSYSAIAIDARQLQDMFGYGHLYHPLGIRKFIRFALDNWTTKPEYLFLIGKGVSYNSSHLYNNNPGAYSFYPLPTWGYPGTDNLFSSFQANGLTYPELATGRLSVRTNDEIAIYFNKVKAYENAVKPTPDIGDNLWKKEVLHIAGATTLDLQNQLLNALNNAKSIIEDTLTNARVTTIFKRSTDPVSSVADRRIDSMINNGVRYISFYGHASSSGFDYNLNSPELQHSTPRFPIFMAYGCEVADIFQLNNIKTISESYLLAPNGGAIAMISSNNFGWTSIIPNYMANLYRELSYRSYHKTLGEQYKANIHYLNNNFTHPFYNIHTQSFILQGDPGLMLGAPGLPDLAIDPSLVSVNPVNINTTMDSFKVKAQYYNIGLSTADSFMVKIQHTRTGSGTVLYTDSFKTAVRLTDSFEISIPVTENAVGLSKVIITLDADETLTELYETNNSVAVDIHIFEEDLVPVYPYEFSILHKADLELRASTLNTMAPFNKYIIEIDTTELFNSPLKKSHNISTKGGTIKWNPGIQLRDSTVYYWRTAVDTLINGDRKWNYSSFIYIAGGQPGWNQSHYYQFLKDKLTGIGLDNARKFHFTPVVKNYRTTNLSVYAGAVTRQNEIHDELDGFLLNRYSCYHGVNTIQIGIFDSVSAEPLNRTIACNRDYIKTMNEFNITTAANRNTAMNFLRSIPDGYYISIKNIIYSGNYVPATMSPIAWQADTNIYGSQNSLYHALKDIGFTDIDLTTTTARNTFLFFRKKGNNTFPVYQKVSAGDEKIMLDLTIETQLDSGFVRSTVIGPAARWETAHWQVSSLDNAPQNDSSYIQIFGIDDTDQETLVYTGIAKDITLSFIDAATYPRIRLMWTTLDTINLTSHHMPFWRVHYTPLPEAALNPITRFTLPGDTLGYGQTLNFRMAVENISDYDMDSMLVRFRVIDRNNVSHELSNVRYRPLKVKDTIEVGLDVDVRQFTGNNHVFIEANPFNDQPEQYHPNNIGYFNFFVNTDNRNPLLDVTFDGVRILDKDIVSAKPLIKILLNDENMSYLLKDTSLFELQLAFPGNISSPVAVPIDGTICKFFPAASGASKNEAYLEYRPDLYEDGMYKLIVKARDNSGNQAGNFDKYEVNFTVDNTPGITNMLNYPNPFSTSTAFVFTLTGSQVPSQLKIQILTVTGKVVREITRQELGPVHIGRNITQYKWDGRDQFGQLLGNGVYLYRVVTHNNGEKLELRANKNVDKYFKNGYGKMYIMR